METSVESSTAAALVGALGKVSAAAVPGLVDALLLTTHCAPSALLLDLLRRFSDVYQERESEAAEKCHQEVEIIHAYLAAVLHLLKHDESDAGDLQKVIWTIYIPLLRSRITNLSTLQIVIVEMLAEAAVERSDWHAIKISFIPLCLQSLYPSFGWNGQSAPEQGLKSIAYKIWQTLEEEHNVLFQRSGVESDKELLSTFAVCQLLAAVLTAALEVSRRSSAEKYNSQMVNGDAIALAQKFCQEMVAVFLAPALSMLSQPLDGSVRRNAMQKLLPPLLSSVVNFGWLDDVSPESRAVAARKSPMQEVWLCCQTLLSHGPSQRQDVYMALALFSDFLFLCEFPSLSHDATRDEVDAEEVKIFDVREEAQFWEEGDADSLTRKRALYILKKALFGPQSSNVRSSNIEVATGPISVIDHLGQSVGKGPINHMSSKRSKWAEKEAGFLGVGAVKEKLAVADGWRQRWEAFILLHETLEEYGIHLVEAAWSHQMSLLLQFTKSKGDARDAVPYWTTSWTQKKSQSVDVNFMWISVLWQRGFDHKNPQVRRLVMQSFLEFEWERTRKLSSLLPEAFILGSLIQALDDSMHHKDFGTYTPFIGERASSGMKGIYSSATAEGAAKFMSFYSTSLPPRRHIGFVVRLAKAVISESRGRAGLMTLAMCLEAAALGQSSTGKSNQTRPRVEQTVPVSDADNLLTHEGSAEVLEFLKHVAENSKHHFNPKYRTKICGHVLRAACALVVLPNVSFSRFAYFLSSFPREQMICGGSLHNLLMSWIRISEPASGSFSTVNKWIFEGLKSMAEEFLRLPGCLSSGVTDEDVGAWRIEAERWARLLAIRLVRGNDLLQIILLIQEHALNIYNHAYMPTCTPERVLLLVQSLLRELSPDFLSSSFDLVDASELAMGEVSYKTLTNNIADMVLSIMDEVQSYTRRSTAIFWEYEHIGSKGLPASVNGKLGGPSQRRLPSNLTSAILQGVLSMSTFADCCLWCCQVGRMMDIPESVVNYLWQFAWEVVTTPRVMNEVVAELQLAALEALTSVCSSLRATTNPFFIMAAHAALKFESRAGMFLPVKPDEMVDGLLKALVKSVDDSAFVGALARSRRGILGGCKWSCLDFLLSISQNSVSGECKLYQEGKASSAVSLSTLASILKDCIDSLECAGEEYLLPLLRTIRWLLQWDVMAHMETDDDLENKYQVMWTLVQSGWSAMVDCNKRKVAPTAAFLSAIFHPAIFGDLGMHGSEADQEEYGPLKWLLNRLIDQGSRSPRTMRLTALHVTGLWLLFPGTTTFYMQELKKLTLYGGETVDEELDGEILESYTAAREYATLVQSCDPELTEEFTNSEMYVRVTVAVMVHELATLVENSSIQQIDTNSLMTKQAMSFGQRFLMELLTAAAEDTDLAKELYKKKSAIHRRKVRVWQMLCILSRFVRQDDALRVATLLKVCLYRNNMPSVRQYIETFTAQVLLRFPHLIEEHLITALHDYNMKTQALSSYVLIATNVLMCTPSAHQRDLLQQVLPAILPFMTSHHHNLRSFTQVLIYRIINRFLSDSEIPSHNQIALAEGPCLRSIADYLEGNLDCTRMRTSVEKHLDTYDPLLSTTPRGIFTIRGGEVDPSKSAEDHPFECVQVAVLDQVSLFLNEAREELRESMAADAIALTTEEFSNLPSARQDEPQHERLACQTESGPSSKSGGSVDIQKKISSLRFSDNSMGHQTKAQESKPLAANNINGTMTTDYDVEEGLLLATIESRAKELTRMRGGRQDIIVVASLVGSIPNLAGLARTCEVFKASSLVVADASIAQDRQFQLISVTAEQWIPIVEVPEAGVSSFLKRKRTEGYSILGLEQTANSFSIDRLPFPNKVVLVLGRESDGIPVDLIHELDMCVEIPQLGVIRSLNVHVSGAIAIWEYTRQHLNRPEHAFL